MPHSVVGYEIASAEKMGKPVLCLFRPEGDRKLSAMIAGSPGATVFEYTSLATAEHAISNFIANIRTPFIVQQ